VRVSIADDRRRFALHHLPDLLIIALPLLRPLRLLRLVMLLRVMNRTATGSLRGKVVTYVAGATVLLVLTSALAVLDAERHRVGANITSFGDALWWACTTITTVGYGDRYPVTTQGRLVAVGLMIAGIALLGVVTAAIASWLIEQIRETGEEQQDLTVDAITELSAEIARLRTMLVQHPER
jgi:voltage-gated potassium channel